MQPKREHGTQVSRRRVKPAAIPAHMLVPGYFTALMRRHDFPPGFVPASEVVQRVVPTATTQERERRADAGVGWAHGTVLMANTPTHAKPMWMPRPKGGA